MHELSSTGQFHAVGCVLNRPLNDTSRVLRGLCSRAFLISAKSSSCPSDVSIVEPLITRSSPLELSKVRAHFFVSSLPSESTSEKGTAYTARILARSDLNRQIIRSPSCEVLIPELELTLPPTSRGQLTTVEGLVRNVYADLNMDQPLRRIQDPEGAATIQGLLDKLQAILGDDEEEQDDNKLGEVDTKKASDKDAPLPAFTLRLDDPAGNSWIEFMGSMADPKWNMREYRRTLEQNIALGLVSADESSENLTSIDDKDGITTDEITEDEVFVFHGNCSSCGHPLDTKMKKVTIPYFKVCLPLLVSSVTTHVCI